MTCIVAQPSRLACSFSGVATRGAEVLGFRRLHAGVRALADVFAARGSDCLYAFVYWDLIDRAGHDHGPRSPACRRSLDELWDAAQKLREVTVLVTADHGQVDVAPDRVDYLDDLWPELRALLSQSRPAGSSRDVFLHVRDEHVGTVIEQLSARLDGQAEVRPAGELFDQIGPRLKARLGDVAVLPSAGRQAWLRSAAAGEQRFADSTAASTTPKPARTWPSWQASVIEIRAGSDPHLVPAGRRQRARRPAPSASIRCPPLARPRRSRHRRGHRPRPRGRAGRRPRAEPRAGGGADAGRQSPRASAGSCSRSSSATATARSRPARSSTNAMPTASVVPPIDTEIVEVPVPEGPYGAKGVGEAPVVGVPGAVVNAIAAATGARVWQLPMTPRGSGG